MPPPLLICRGLQGVGAGMFISTGMAILTSVFPPKRRGRVIGIYVAAVYIGLSAGPFVGGLLTLLGPAFVAAVAYVDPGNVAANITAGARYGYSLVWVLVLANTMAVLIQYQSAKLGIVTPESYQRTSRSTHARLFAHGFIHADKTVDI